jgi:hypothetical protein
MPKQIGDNTWTQEELDILRAAHLSRTAGDVSQELGRTISACQTKATHLGIRFLNRSIETKQEHYAERPTYPCMAQYDRLTPRQKVKRLLSKAAHELTPAEATAAHKFDLILAGHKPGTGELDIGPDGGCPWSFAPEPCTIYRSPAAALVEG